MTQFDVELMFGIETNFSFDWQRTEEFRICIPRESRVVSRRPIRVRIGVYLVSVQPRLL